MEKLTREELEKEYSLCYLCKAPICKFLLTGQVLFGQEIKFNKKTGGYKTVKCPHYEFDEDLVNYNWKKERPSKIEAKIDYTEMYEELIDEYKKTSYIYKYILNL